MTPVECLPSWSSVPSRCSARGALRRAARGAGTAAVIVLSLTIGGTISAQQTPESQQVEELKAQLIALLKQQDAQHRAEIEALTKTIGDLTARVRQLEAERASSPPSRPAQGAPTLAAGQPTPAPTAPPPAPETAGPPSKELPPEGHALSATIPINIYGSLRFKSAVDSGGTVEMQDNASRLGLKAEMPIGSTSSTAYARAEVGMRLIKNDTSAVLHPDPAGPTANANNVFSARLGYVGFKTPVGTVTWGKQWSVYYDIGGWTDQFSAWGGEAQDSFNAGTDGSASGTGRVDQALIYRTPDAPLKLALQAQNRTLTNAGVSWGDTLAASLQWGKETGVSVGVAYVEVRDGVREPASGQPKKGDRSFIAGVKFFQDPVYVAVSYADFDNHEQDDAGTWFSGRGYELYAQYSLTARWSIYAGLNDQEPNGSYRGLFRLRYVDAGARYAFHGTSFLFFEIKPEDSRNASGGTGRKNAVAVGAFFDF